VQLDAGSEKMMKSPDVAFALQSAQCSQAGVRLGQLAVQKATSPGVKALGQQMIDDHSKAFEKLKLVAADENLALPESLNAKDQAAYSKLLTESGDKFDRDYVKAIANNRKEQIKDCRKEMKKGKDPAIKEFAEGTLATLQINSQKIEAIHSGA
jgi:putative membrane protein